jgi:tetratricopeptide (TPR) repeat protein
MRALVTITGLALLMTLAVGLPSAAAESMSVRTYERLQIIEALMADQKLAQAEKKLGALLADLPSQKADQAYIHYTAATLQLRKNDYARAKAHFIKAYELDSFPDKTLLYVIKTLAGLCMQAEDFREAVTYYKAYLEKASGPDKEVFLGLGTAYYYLKDYAAAIEILTAAIDRFEPRPSPYLMLFSAYYELKQLGPATRTLEQMIRLWPARSQYWLQLAGLYIEQEAYDQSLEIMQAALAQGYLTKEADLLQYVYALYEEQLPYKAAAVLKEGLGRQVVAENLKHYELLATLLQEAKERPQAIEALKKASAYAQDGQSELSIAQLCFEMENAHPAVIEHARRAVERGIEQEGKAYILMAVAYSELGRIDDAKACLQEAAKFKESHQASQQWLRALE